MYATAVDVLVFLCRLDLGSLLVKIFLYRWFSFSSAGLTDPLCSLPGQAPKKATAGKGGDIFWAHPQEIDSCRPVSFFLSLSLCPFRFPVTKIKKKNKSRSGLGTKLRTAEHGGKVKIFISCFLAFFFFLAIYRRHILGLLPHFWCLLNPRSAEDIWPVNQSPEAPNNTHFPYAPITAQKETRKLQTGL